MNLRPARLWAHFEALSRLPRCSGNEAAAGDYVLEVARRSGLHAHADECGNVIVRKPASSGVAAPPVILQAHLDMVCEKRQGCAHDFARDPIVPVVDGEWIRAEGTSLGADNGIGLAAALAVLEDWSLVHPPVELLATVEEEIGLKGAAAISETDLQGRRLINLDSEEEHAILVGCAGGIEVSAGRDLPCVPFMMLDGRPARVVVEGLRGGHSGIDIDKGRGNALSVLGVSLNDLREIDSSFRLITLAGGTKSNAIPRDAHAEILLADTAGLENWAHLQTAKWRQALGARDPGLTVRIETSASGGLVFSPDSTSRLLHFLTAFPHGVWAVDADLGNLVDTSANLAVVEAGHGSFRVVTSLRGSSAQSLDLSARRVESLLRLMGCVPERSNAYPAWPRAVDSSLRVTAEEVFHATYGRAPAVLTVHAGLECGILAQRLPGLDAISIGPTIVSPHSPDERVHIESVGRFWGFLTALLARLAV